MSSPEFPSLAVPELGLPFEVTQEMIDAIAKVGNEASDRVRYAGILASE